MKKVLISMGFAALALGATAQVKIKDGTVTSSTTPNSNAILELESKQRGLLYPRVALTSTSSASPLSAHVKGMVVYDTVSAGSGATAVSPGLYYNDGTQWVRAAQPNDWLVFGSSTAARNGSSAGNTDSQYVMGRVAIGVNTMQRLYDPTARTDSAHKFAYLATNGDASINGMTVGRGGGQSEGSVAVGLEALYHDLGNSVTYGANTAIGFGALYNNTSGYGNTAIGDEVMFNNTLGFNNTAIGSGSLQNMTTGNDNIGIGFRSNAGTTGGFNVGIGYNATAGTTGSENVALGDNVNAGSLGGILNTAIGGSSNAGTTGNYNIAIGGNANAGTTGSNNVAIGVTMSVADPTASNQLNIANVIWGTNMGGYTGPSNSGLIGINTSAPNSSLYVNGSFGLPFQTRTANYTLGARDYTVRFTSGAATLPDPTNGGVTPNLSGRMYRIVNATGAAMTVTATSGTVTLLGATFATGTAALFQTDGTNWYQVQ